MDVKKERERETARVLFYSRTRRRHLERRSYKPGLENMGRDDRKAGKWMVVEELVLRRSNFAARKAFDSNSRGGGGGKMVRAGHRWTELGLSTMAPRLALNLTVLAGLCSDVDAACRIFEWLDVNMGFTRKWPPMMQTDLSGFVNSLLVSNNSLNCFDPKIFA